MGSTTRASATAASATTAVLADLVRFDTTSRRSNLDLIAWVEGHLAAHGVAATRIPDATGTKAGLLARIGPDAPGGVLLCGHTDTVPVDGQAWATDPFALTRVGDRVAGRGTVDMKGFIAAALAVTGQAVEADLQAPLWLGLTCDEEVGALGAPALAEALLDQAHPPAWAVIGEATGMQVVRAHKGVRVLRTTVVGRDAHSSQPGLGASAVMGAARVITRIEEVADALRDGALQDERFDPPHTTMNVGLVQGGTALNIIPRTCDVTWELRWVPDQDPDAVVARVVDDARDVVLPRLRRTAPDAAITTEVLAQVPPIDPAGNGEAAAALARITGAATGSAVAYGTDGGVLQAAGIPCVVLGPGETGQMHQPDESIAVDDLAACDAALAAIVTDLERRP